MRHLLRDRATAGQGWASLIRQGIQRFTNRVEPPSRPSNSVTPESKLHIPAFGSAWLQGAKIVEEPRKQSVLDRFIKSSTVETSQAEVHGLDDIFPEPITDFFMGSSVSVKESAQQAAAPAQMATPEPEVQPEPVMPISAEIPLEKTQIIPEPSRQVTEKSAGLPTFDIISYQFMEPEPEIEVEPEPANQTMPEPVTQTAEELVSQAMPGFAIDQVSSPILRTVSEPMSLETIEAESDQSVEPESVEPAPQSAFGLGLPGIRRRRFVSLVPTKRPEIAKEIESTHLPIPEAVQTEIVQKQPAITPEILTDLAPPPLKSDSAPKNQGTPFTESIAKPKSMVVRTPAVVDSPESDPLGYKVSPPVDSFDYMLKNNKILSSSILNLADQYFARAAAEEAENRNEW